MYCRKCGAKLIDDSQFCPKCGTKVEDQDSKPSEPVSKESPAVEKPEAPETKASEESAPLMFSVDEPATKRPSQAADSSGASSTPASPLSSMTGAGGSQTPLASGEYDLPPSLLPKPDGFGSPNEQTEVAKERKKKRKKRKKKQRWHPLDTYQPLREKFRLGGCGLLFFLVFVVPVAVVGFLVWLQYTMFVDQEGFESVIHKEANLIDAPDKKSLYWGMNVLYEPAETDVEVAFIGNSWWLSGTFKEKVYFRGYQLVLEEGVRFEKGLDVNAVRFQPGTAEIEGELTGNIALQQ